jgi:pescadillo
MQAEVMGQAVTWLVPHAVSQVLPQDVDYRVMLTFLEFYHTLLQFVNFKLYHGLGIKYPPLVDSRLEKAAAGLTALMRDLAQVRCADRQTGFFGRTDGSAPLVVDR